MIAAIKTWWAEAPERLATRRGAAIALASLCAFHVLVSFLWLAFDNHVIRIDESFHAQGAQDIYYLIKSDEYPNWSEKFAAFRENPSPYPPLVHAFGALLALIFGYSVNVLALTGVVSFVLTLVGVYLLAQPMLGRHGALFSAAVAGFIPILFAGSRYVVLENAVMALTVWALVAIVKSENFSRIGWVLLFALFNGLAILAKPTAFAYYLLPSAVFFGWGLVQGFRAGSAGGLRILGHGLLVLAVSGAVALPWYVDNFRFLERYWMTEHKRGQTPFTFSEPVEAEPERTPPADLALLAPPPEAPTTEALPAAPRLPVPVTPPLEARPPDPGEVPLPAELSDEAPVAIETVTPDTDAGPREWRVVPAANRLLQREWAAYPIALVNNATFLPLALVSLLGLLLMPLASRFRNRHHLLVCLWFFGAYLAMTLLFRYINPRYTMPMVPALGIGAAGLVYLLPPGIFRARLMLAMLALLFVQFLHVSFGPVNRGDTWLPFMQDRFRVAYYRDQGISVYKSKVVAGTYTFRAPQLGANYVDRAFHAMINHERAVGGAPGRSIQYGVIQRQNNFGGFGFIQRHYWPEPNPVLYRALRGVPEAQYRFEKSAIFMRAEDIPDNVEGLDYLVVTLQDAEAIRSVGPYHRYTVGVMEAAPFEIIDHYRAPEYGLLPPVIVTVLARKTPTPTPVPEDGNIFAGYSEWDLQRMEAAKSREIRTEIAAFFNDHCEPVPLNASIAHCFTSVRRISEKLVHFRSVFKCTQAIERDFNVAFELTDQVTGETLHHPIEPATPASSWEPGFYYYVDRYAIVPPGEYGLGVFFFDETSPYGSRVDVGVTEF